MSLWIFKKYIFVQLGFAFNRATFDSLCQKVLMSELASCAGLAALFSSIWQLVSTTRLSFSVTGIHIQYHLNGLCNGSRRSNDCSSTLTNFIKNFNFHCTEFKSSWQKVRQLPEWSWHVFSQITTDLLAAENSIITLKLKWSNGHVN